MPYRGWHSLQSNHLPISNAGVSPTRRDGRVQTHHPRRLFLEQKDGNFLRRQKEWIKNTSRNLVFFGHQPEKMLQVPFFLEQKKGLQKSHEITCSHYSSIRKDFKAIFSKSWDCHSTKCLMNDHIFALFNPPLILIVQVFLGVGGDILSNLLLQSSG